MKRQIRAIIVFVFISLATGLVAGLISSGAMADYAAMTKPPFAPPGYIFPIIWTVLYILMGIGAGLVWCAHSPFRETGICLYALQLAVNFLWPIIFFVEGWYFAAFLWLLLLLALVIAMTYTFYRAKPLAAYLQAPYIVWLVFAGILNLWIALTN